jgi:hypothetical protein
LSVNIDIKQNEENKEEKEERTTGLLKVQRLNSSWCLGEKQVRYTSGWAIVFDQSSCCHNDKI